MLQDYIYLKQWYLYDNPVPTWEQCVHETNTSVPSWERNAVEGYIAG
jgi:hypothetical protein